MSNFEYRMYGLVPYNISPIQQGIQFGHGVVEYMLTFGKTDLCHKWANYYKTFIILNGGSTNKGTLQGTLNQHLQTLQENEIPLATFYEPDLGDQLTSINFIVDEKVFNKEKYPDLIYPASIEEYSVWEKSIGGSKNAFLREFIKKFRLA